MGYLKKAKTKLEQEKPKLDKQFNIQEKIKAELEISNKELFDKKVKNDTKV